MKVIFKAYLSGTPHNEMLTVEHLIDDYDLKDMTDQARKEYLEGKARDWANKHLKVTVEA